MEDATTWLKWAHAQCDPGALKALIDCPREREETPDGLKLALQPSPHLYCLAAVLADRHNADTCFVAVLQDMLEGAGHRMVLSPTLVGEKKAFREARNAASPAAKAQFLQEAYVTDDPEEIYALRDRIRLNDATEEDKWLDYKLSYLDAWGLGDVDAAFVQRHGHSFDGPKRVLLLMRVLIPALATPRMRVTEEVELVDRVDELRVRCIREVIAALGLRHALDDATRCADYWQEPFEQSQLYRTATVFRDYERAAPLFRDAAQVRKESRKTWTRQTTTQLLNSVLDAIGLSLVPTRQGKVNRTYTYVLDPTCVAEMRELLALKLRTMWSWADGHGTLRITPPDLHARLASQAITRHAHLLQRRPRPETPPASEHGDAQEAAEERRAESGDGSRR